MTRKSLAALAFAALFIAGGLLMLPSKQVEALPARDLKYFPKDIKVAKLYKEMKAISAQLGVKCAFCHVMTPTKQFHKETKHKKIALDMLLMTREINARVKKAMPKDYKQTVTCYTCHQGAKHPVHEAEEEEEDE